MDRTLFFGVVAALGLAAALAGWALGWPGPALVAAAGAWARLQFRLGEVAGQAQAPPDTLTAALPWGSALAAMVAIAWIFLAG
ncbi:hypothetical protein [Algihabitans albus]|uniref:hypothetical protein n=1 Tax=Algihabitans albus TaxID=2164067 RepID=UPI0013C353EC|nr:hypothetical protein [Algihabitans albus]